MLDLGRSFIASVERDPNMIAVVEGDRRLAYADWSREISAVVQGLGQLGVKRGDRLVSVLQNSLAAATLHWACQLAGVTIVPINWRAKPDEIDFALENAEAAALIVDASSVEAARQAACAARLPRVTVDVAPDETAWAGAVEFSQILAQSAPDASPQAQADDWSVMLYTSGTTARPKGVPRRHRAERAAAIAHVAQNLMPRGERTLGVMPLYHTMGVRSLLSMSLLGGAFVCLPHFDVEGALSLIERERISSLYLVPTLYHDLLAHPGFAPERIASVRRVGFAGASMTDGLMRRIADAFQPELFVNHYGSSEIYTFTVDQQADRKPGSAGKAGLNQSIRVIAMDADDPDAVVPNGVEGQIIALLSGDEAFEGYWRRPDADAKSLRGDWYFTGDMGGFDADGDLFVTGRVDDMIITGGENVSPVEVESCLSLHPAVAEVAVVGLPDERWGRIVAAFIRRAAPVAEQDLDRHCRDSGLANFKRPRRFVFVDALPKSPVGKLLRRRLVDGSFQAEAPESAS